jgi:hypothetical protein
VLHIQAVGAEMLRPGAQPGSLILRPGIPVAFLQAGIVGHGGWEYRKPRIAAQGGPSRP